MISTGRHSINASDPYAEISEESGDGYDTVAPLINPPIEGKNMNGFSNMFATIVIYLICIRTEISQFFV